MLPAKFVVPFRSATTVAGILSVGALCAALAVAAHPTAAGAAPRPASTDFASFAASSSLEITGRGNGHGHGLSQYGAQGAALAGLTSRQIVQFYYPDTTLKTLPASTIRVSLSNAGWATTVAHDSGLALVGYGALPSGYTRFRLAPDGSGLALGGLNTNGNWVRVRSGLPTRADFSSPAGSVRVYLTDGTSTRYRGTVGAVRDGSGILTINRTSLDSYTMGVVPREMPASWRASALGAQAIAARSYGRNAVESHGGSSYDICDTTWCQVYGGMTHYSSGGSVLWQDAPFVVQGNENTVVQYGGRTIFAQFSASNGGAMLSGGLPYLVSKADPYDNAGSGDPYLGWTDTASASSVASYYGLQSVSSVQVTARSGSGPWGGWVTAGQVAGTDWSGHSKTVAATGTGLASAMGLRTAYFQFDGAAKPGAPQDVHAVSGESGAGVYWSPPSNTSDVANYRVTWGKHSYTVPGTARKLFISPIWQAQPENVWITATNGQGTGPAARVSVQGKPRPERVVAVSPQRIIDTRQAPIDADHPYEVDVRGLGSIPTSGATSLQLSLTIANTSDSGTLDIYVHGSPAVPVVSVPYRAHQFATSTVSVPLRPSSSLIFKPSKGSLTILADQQSYTAATGKYIRPVSPLWSRTVSSIATDGSSTLSLHGAPVVNGDTESVLLSVRLVAGDATTWLRMWPDGQPQPQVVHVSSAPYGPSATTVLMRLPDDGLIHLAAGRPGTSAVVTLVGTTGNGGGRLEAIPATVVADDAVPSRPSLQVGTDITTVKVAGVADTPSDARAVLVQVRVTSDRLRAKVWAWPGGHRQTGGAAAVVGGGTTSVTSELVMLGADGTISLRANTGVKVSLLSMGYLTVS